MQIRDIFERKQYVFLDGGMGTMLQAAGLPLGERPELLAITRPELLTSIHAAYIEAGSDIVYANTFGASAKKLEGTGHTVEELVPAALDWSLPEPCTLRTPTSILRRSCAPAATRRT